MIGTEDKVAVVHTISTSHLCSLMYILPNRLVTTHCLFINVNSGAGGPTNGGTPPLNTLNVLVQCRFRDSVVGHAS